MVDVATMVGSALGSSGRTMEVGCTTNRQDRRATVGESVLPGGKERQEKEKASEKGSK